MNHVTLLSAAEFLAQVATSDLVAELGQLADRAGDVNPFYESWMLVPALTWVESTGNVYLVVVRGSQGELLGLFPFQLSRDSRWAGAWLLQSWRHKYCFLCTPLIDRRHVEAIADAFAEWLRSGDAPASAVEFSSVGIDGAFGTRFLPRLSGQSRWGSDSGTRQRAYLHCGTQSEVGLSGKHQKEVRRLQRRLAELGSVNVATMRKEEPCGPWLDRFLKLEGSGWKGRQNTALHSNDADRRFFAAIAMGAHTLGRLQMLSLQLGGLDIAMKCNLLAPPGSFAFKIGFDERFQQHSPGLLLEIFNMRSLPKQAPEVLWMDSCADPGSQMIERLWTGRREIAWSRHVARGLRPKLLIAGAPAYRRAKAVLRRFVPHQVSNEEDAM
jgi:CelD/BcsL family acetyltransferase involved in cellulose biosynthesis